MATPRLTLQTKLVVQALSKNPLKARYGLELSKEAGLPAGTIYPLLARLERAGWVSSEWEDIDPVTAGRPRRRHYWLTGEGVRISREIAAHNPLPSWIALPGTADTGGGPV